MSEDMKVAKDSIDESTVEGVRSLEADKYKYGFDTVSYTHLTLPTILLV